MVIWRPWHVQLRFFTQELVAEREQPIVHQKVCRKVPPIHPKKTDLGWWDHDMCTPTGCGKGTPAGDHLSTDQSDLAQLQICNIFPYSLQTSKLGSVSDWYEYTSYCTDAPGFLHRTTACPSRVPGFARRSLKREDVSNLDSWAPRKLNNSSGIN